MDEMNSRTSLPDQIEIKNFESNLPVAERQQSELDWMRSGQQTTKCARTRLIAFIAIERNVQPVATVRARIHHRRRNGSMHSE